MLQFIQIMLYLFSIHPSVRNPKNYPTNQITAILKRFFIFFNYYRKKSYQRRLITIKSVKALYLMKWKNKHTACGYSYLSKSCVKMPDM